MDVLSLGTRGVVRVVGVGCVCAGALGFRVPACSIPQGVERIVMCGYIYTLLLCSVWGGGLHGRFTTPGTILKPKGSKYHCSRSLVGDWAAKVSTILLLGPFGKVPVRTLAIRAL